MAWCAAIAVGLGLVSGCATYRPLALPATPDLAGSLALTVPTERLGLPGLAPHVIDPAKGFDETAVITLAVLQNPDLKAARLRAGVAAAQLLEAGLLPDPQIAAGLTHSALHTGYSLGLDEDIRALITRSAARAAAQAGQRQVNLDILWQEWQVAGRARELFIQAGAERRLRLVLTRRRDLLADRYRRDAAAVRRGEATGDVLAADLADLTAADSSLRQLQLGANQTNHALDELLGFAPGVKLPLLGAAPASLLSPFRFQAAVKALPHRRADLLALQAGYESQEERLREAVLSQFPSLTAGVEQARSAEEGIHTVGFTVNLALPLFNRNRGQIAVRRATRALLRQTYQARLDAAASQADELWHAARLMARQQHALAARRVVLERAAREAEQSVREGDFPIGTYIHLQSESLAARAEAIRLGASLARAQAALQTVLGLPIGPAPDS